MSIEGMSYFISQQKISKIDTTNKEITTEQKEILESAIQFAKYLTNRWPQIDLGKKLIIEIDDKGATIELPELPKDIKIEQRINYYLSGSLATMILSQAEKFTEIDEKKIPALVEVCTKEIPISTRKILSSFARQIGDIDYIPIEHYKTNPTRLKKGGGGPSFDEIPEIGCKILKQNKNQVKVMCDPVETYGPKRIVKVNIDGKDYYITRPDNIFAYKVLHLLQSYQQKPETFNNDFKKLLEALKEMYSEEKLIQITYQVLTDYKEVIEALYIHRNEDVENLPPYEKKVPKLIERVLTNPQISIEIETILKKLQKLFN